MTIEEEKCRLRDAASRARDRMAGEAPEAAAAVAERFLSGGLSGTLERHAGCVVSGYFAVRSEIDVGPLMRELSRRGHPIALPVVADRADPLIFRLWRPGDPLQGAPFGLSVPPEDAAEAVPEILIVPMLAADETGYRLGYGGGYYDRTLAALRRLRDIVAIGVGFDGQIVKGVPRDKHDARLDWIVTDRRVLDCRASGGNSG